MAAAEDCEFLGAFPEDLKLAQYWYSAPTIRAIVGEVQDRSRLGCAFLSTPSLFCSLTDPELRARSRLFEFDRTWASDPGFVFYDFRQPLEVPAELHHKFDMVVIDAPSIDLDVVQAYLRTAALLLADPLSVPESAPSFSSLSELQEDPPKWIKFATREAWKESLLEEEEKEDGQAQQRRNKVLITSIAEHDWLLDQYFRAEESEDSPASGMRRQWFRPSIPSLMYQYSIFLNYASPKLGSEYNPEVDEVEGKASAPPPDSSRKALPAYLRQ